MLGALARYGIGAAAPTAEGSFPLATFLVNVLGCGLIGVLSVLITDVWPGRPLLRPFLGTGVLGGFTTFSSYALEGQQLLAQGHLVVAAAYLLGTVTAALGGR